jgi:hypothetical protein
MRGPCLYRLYEVKWDILSTLSEARTHVRVLKLLSGLARQVDDAILGHSLITAYSFKLSNHLACMKFG